MKIVCCATSVIFIVQKSFYSLKSTPTKPISSEVVVVITNSVIVIFIVICTVTFHVWKWNKILRFTHSLCFNSICLYTHTLHTEVCWFDNGYFSKNCQPSPIVRIHEWESRKVEKKRKRKSFYCAQLHIRIIISSSLLASKVFRFICACISFYYAARTHNTTYACYLVTYIRIGN